MRTKFLVAALLLTALLIACGEKEANWLVKVKDQTLRSDLFVRRYKMTKDYTQHPAINPALLRQFIEKNQLPNLAFQAEGYALGLDKDSTIAAQIANEERRMLTRNNGPLFKAVVPASFDITEAELTAAWEKGNTEYRLAHILVKSPQLADSISQALQSGAGFEALVTKYSMDPNTVETRGEMAGWINWMQMAPTFADAVLAAPAGSYTKPVSTNYGYHIIKVLEIRPRQNPSLEASRANIAKTLQMQKQGQFIEDYLRGLYEKYDLKVDSVLAMRILPAMIAAKPPAKVDFAMISPEDQKKTLMTYDGGQWSVRETLDRYIAMTRGSNYRLTRYADLTDFVRKASITDMMYRDAKARKLDQNDEFRSDFEYGRSQLVGQKARERLVTRAVQLTDADLLAFYEQHKADYQNKPLSEIQSTVRARLQSTRTLELQDKKTAELIAKYKPKWNEKELEKVAAELNAAKAETAANRPAGAGQMPGGTPSQMPVPMPSRSPDTPPAPPQGVR